MFKPNYLTANKIFWEELKIPLPYPEYKFHSTRRWRVDYAWPDVKLAVEIEGGIFKFGRHNRPSGFIKDLEKYNALTENEWSLLRYLPEKINYEQLAKVYNLLKKRD